MKYEILENKTNICLYVNGSKIGTKEKYSLGMITIPNSKNNNSETLQNKIDKLYALYVLLNNKRPDTGDNYIPTEEKVNFVLMNNSKFEEFIYIFINDFYYFNGKFIVSEKYGFLDRKYYLIAKKLRAWLNNLDIKNRVLFSYKMINEIKKKEKSRYLNLGEVQVQLEQSGLNLDVLKDQFKNKLDKRKIELLKPLINNLNNKKGIKQKHINKVISNKNLFISR